MNIELMAKPKNKNDRHKSPRITLRLPHPAGEILRSIAKKNHRTLTAEILLALQDHAKREGCEWPPDSDDD